MSSSNGRFTCCFYFSSDMYSSGEFEFDLSSSPGCLGGVLAKPEPFLIKLFPKSYLSGLSEIFFLAWTILVFCYRNWYEINKMKRSCVVAYLCQLRFFLGYFSAQYVIYILIVTSGWVAIRSLLSFWTSGQLIFSSKAKTILLVWWTNLVGKEGISTVWVFPLTFHLWGSLGLNGIWRWRSSF